MALSVGNAYPTNAYGANTVYGSSSVSGTEKLSPKEKLTGEKECKTCENRKYQDGSNEMVSFKAAAHIPAQAAASVVRAHEQEHVSNAYAKADQKGGEVVRASVSIHTAICPECGRSYISGGTTSTQIRYPNESNPYQQDLKTADAARLRGLNVDYAV